MKIILYTLFLFFSIFISIPGQKSLKFNEIKTDLQNQNNKIHSIFEDGMKLSPRESEKLIALSDSLLLMSEGEDDVYSIAYSLILKGKAFYNTRNFDSSLVNFKSAIDIFDEQDRHDDFYFQTRTLYAISLIRLRKYDEAQNEYETQLSLANQSGNVNHLVSIYGNLANLRRNVRDYIGAINYYEKLMDLSQNNLMVFRNSLYNVGTMYMVMEEYEKANNYFNDALNIRSKNDIALLSLFTAKANNFLNWAKRDSARVVIDKCLSKFGDDTKRYDLFRPKLMSANLYFEEGKIERAKIILEEIITNLNKDRRKREYLEANILLAEIYSKDKEYSKSIKLSKDMIRFSEKFRLKNNLKKTYYLISENYKQLGEQDSSLKYLKAQLNYDEQINKRALKLAQVDANAKYNYSKMKNKVVESEADNSLKLVVIIILLVGILILIYLVRKFILKHQIEKKYNDDLLWQKNIQEEKIAHLKEKLKNMDNNTKMEKDSIFVDNSKIYLNDIVFINSSGHYVYYNLLDRKTPIIERKNLKDALTVLPQNQFLQVHRSYIINVSHVKSFTHQKVIMINEQVIKMSRTYKNLLFNVVDRN